MRRSLIKLISTFFFTGYLPLMPGTWASLGGVAVYFIVSHNVYIAFGLCAIFLSFGFIFAGEAEKIFGKKDDRRIVIDEASSVILLFLFIPPQRNYLIAAFILFRLFDIIKPFPAKRLEKLPRAWGIMADDLIAALYSYLLISVFI